MNVVWTETALSSLEAIYYYTQSWSQNAGMASVLNDLLVKSCLILAKNPYAGPLESSVEDQVEVYRSLVVHKYYKLIYRVLEETQTVEIAAVWDVRRNPKTLSV